MWPLSIWSRIVEICNASPLWLSRCSLHTLGKNARAPAPALSIRLFTSRRGERWLGQAQQVLAHVRRPAGDQLLEPGAVTPVEGAVGLLEARPVAGQRGHRAARRRRGPPGARPRRLVADGLLDESAQGRRRASRLVGQPVPVPREQRDLAGDDAQLGPAGPARLGSGQVALEDLLEGPAQLEVHLPAGGVVEDQQVLAGVGV